MHRTYVESTTSGANGSDASAAQPASIPSETYTDHRYASGFNPGLIDAGRKCWVSAGHYGLDQGIVTMMIENHRTQLIWRLMQKCPYVVDGLRRAGFTGGWL